MSAREWKPGDVALVNGRICIRTTDHRWEHGDERAFKYTDHEAHITRPLVVIDPEGREQVERLRKALSSKGVLPLNEEDFWRLQGALREFATPTPPKPVEPQGVGAVVEDAGGMRWVSRGGSYMYPWCPVHPSGVGGSRPYADVNAVRVLSAGVTQ